LHIGGVRTALFNYLFAKKHGGDFILRIEDTDRTRLVSGAEQYIIDSFKWLGLNFDDGVNLDGTAKYRQSEREYRSYAETLIKSGHAYYAFDTSSELDALKESLKAAGVKNPNYNNVTRERMRNSFTLPADEVEKLLNDNVPYVIRFNVPKRVEVKFIDAVKGLVSFWSDNMDDKILFKSDGLPTYHLANVVDDHLMEITHVIRGDEWLPSALLHVMLYNAFGWEHPIFCHLPVINGPDGKKLSKRHGDKYGFPVFPMTWDYVNEEGESVHITGFKEEGYESNGLINFLSLLGWNPGNNIEFMSLEEMVSLFDLERVNNSPAMFDMVKLKNFNAHYMRSVDDLQSYRKWIDDGSRSVHYDDATAVKINIIAKERCEFAKDLYKQVSYFFEPVVIPENHKLKHELDFPVVMSTVMNYILINHATFKWEAAEINKAIEVGAVNMMNKTLSVVRPDLRFALCGSLPGPDLGLIMEILGQRESFKRIYALLPEVFQRTLKMNSKYNFAEL
jgi:glutamyl-tRNA synthetase